MAVMPATRTPAPVPARRAAVLLLTDGAPICNPDLDPATCECSVSPCQVALQCIDRDRSLAKLSALTQAGIRVAVVGLGDDVLAPPHLDPLHQLALQGDAPALCGAQPCSPAFFTVGDPLPSALEAALR
jgi:hypothetical protein